jgi:hypothetical protein
MIALMSVPPSFRPWMEACNDFNPDLLYVRLGFAMPKCFPQVHDENLWPNDQDKHYANSCLLNIVSLVFFLIGLHSMI